MAIQLIVNRSKATVQFRNVESAGKDDADVPSESAQYNGAWVPWCRSTDEFAQHHISVSTVRSTYYIWEYKGEIYATQSKGWSSEAAKISPHSGKEDGVLIIEDDGSIKMFPLRAKQSPAKL